MKYIFLKGLKKLFPCAFLKISLEKNCKVHTQSDGTQDNQLAKRLLILNGRGNILGQTDRPFGYVPLNTFSVCFKLYVLSTAIKSNKDVRHSYGEMKMKFSLWPPKKKRRKLDFLPSFEYSNGVVIERSSCHLAGLVIMSFFPQIIDLES